MRVVNNIKRCCYSQSQVILSKIVRWQSFSDLGDMNREGKISLVWKPLLQDEVPGKELLDSYPLDQLDVRVVQKGTG